MCTATSLAFSRTRKKSFEQLWDARETMYLAHQSVPIPSRNASLLVAALHQLRDGNSRADHDELASVTRIDLSDSERRDLVALAAQTGALGPVRALLPALGIQSGDLPPQVETTELRAWRARIDADASGAYFWMVLLERTPPRERIGVLARALWPPRRDLLINNPGSRDTVAGRTAARLARFPKGLRGLPRALRAIWARRRAAASGRTVTGT